jgi:hypothetical protein
VSRRRLAVARGGTPRPAPVHARLEFVCRTCDKTLQCVDIIGTDFPRRRYKVKYRDPDTGRTSPAQKLHIRCNTCSRSGHSQAETQLGWEHVRRLLIHLEAFGTTGAPRAVLRVLV